MAMKNNDLLEQENQTLGTSASADFGIELPAADTSLTMAIPRVRPIRRQKTAL